MVGQNIRRLVFCTVFFLVGTGFVYGQYQRKAGLNGRPVRGNSGLKWVSIQSIRKQQTMVNQIVNGVVGTKPNSAAKKKEITAIQKRLSIRVPLSIVPLNNNQGGQGSNRNTVLIYGLNWNSWWFTTRNVRPPGWPIWPEFR